VSIDATPDGVPVISEVPSLPGFYIASGFSGHGFGIGPGAGHLMADLVTNATPMRRPHRPTATSAWSRIDAFDYGALSADPGSPLSGTAP
jgi:glycine/D-amino acid oxidase-like deaminating enzyme